MTPPTRLDTARTPRTRLDAAPMLTPATRVDEAGQDPEYRRENLPPGLAARLRMGREIGRGAEASVWLCTDADGNEHAVKLFRHPPRYTTDFGSDEYRAHFRPECAVQIVERDVDHGVHYEVMEYCRFGTLDGLLERNGGFGTHKRAVEILWQLARALHGMQRPEAGRTLVHGDVKPKNILVRAEIPLDLVLTDFGLTVDIGDRSKLTGRGEGTLAYMAPGAVQYLAPESDWWSVGMVMFQVLVGRGYFQREDGGWVDDRTIERELTIRDVSLAALDGVALRTADRERWRMLLAGLLTRDPELRWGMALVSEWHSGGSPPVHRSIEDRDDTGAVSAATHRASVPYPLPGAGQFFLAEELGLAMSRDPDAAARSLAGRGLQALLTWLTDEAKTGVGYTDLKTHGGTWGPDELATYFIAQLAPTTAPTYRRRPVGTRAELGALALDVAAADCVRDLFASNLLGALAGPTRPDHKMIDADWHDMVAQARTLARTRNIGVDERALTHIVRYGLVLATGDDAVADAYLTSVRDRLDAPDMALAGEATWFDRLRKESRI